MPAAKFALPCNWLQVKDNSMDPVHTAFLHALSSGYQFTEAFGVVPELDWMTTEAGMVYIATRRVGDLVWVRVCDFMPPNVHQFTREIEEATQAKAASRPVIIRWAVPNDDTHTTNFELAQVDPAWGLTPEQVAQPGFGQSDDRSYAERQRQPGGLRRAVEPAARSRCTPSSTWPRPTAASSCCGASCATASGRWRAARTRRGRAAGEGKIIRTFTQDTVLRVPPAADPEEDRRLLRATGRDTVNHR